MNNRTIEISAEKVVVKKGTVEIIPPDKCNNYQAKEIEEISQTASLFRIQNPSLFPMINQDKNKVGRDTTRIIPTKKRKNDDEEKIKKYTKHRLLAKEKVVVKKETTEIIPLNQLHKYTKAETEETTRGALYTKRSRNKSKAEKIKHPKETTIPNKTFLFQSHLSNVNNVPTPLVSLHSDKNKTITNLTR